MKQKLPDADSEFEIRALLFAKVSNGPVVENPEVGNELQKSDCGL